MGAATQGVAARRESAAVNDKIQLFVSHKHQDFQAAHGLKEILAERGGDQLRIFVSEQDITGGEEWGASLKEVLQSSRLLILLYTNPTDEWDWCLYETGLFTPLKSDPQRRVICFHAESIGPPKPIRNLQSVPIAPPEPDQNLSDDEVRRALAGRNTRLVDAFLKPFFLSTELVGQKINPTLNSEQLNRIATEIAALFAPQKIERQYPVKRLIIEYPDGAEFTENQIADEALVTTTNENLAILGMGFKSCTWSDLMARMTEANMDTHWTTELVRQVYAHRTGRAFLNKPITNTFRGVDDNRIYRPLMYRIDIKNHKPFRFHVVFSEEPSPHLIGDTGIQSSVFNLLRLTNRTRAEVIDRFLGELGRSLAIDELRAVLQRLQTALRLIEDEAAEFGYLVEQRVEELFEGDEDKQTIARLFRDRDRNSQALTEAIKAGTADDVKQQLEDLRGINQTFILLASERYASLIRESYGPTVTEG